MKNWMEYWKIISFEDGWYVDGKHFCAYVRTLASYSSCGSSSRKNLTLLFFMIYLCFMFMIMFTSCFAMRRTQLCGKGEGIFPQMWTCPRYPPCPRPPIDILPMHKEENWMRRKEIEREGGTHGLAPLYYKRRFCRGLLFSTPKYAQHVKGRLKRKTKQNKWKEVKECTPP
jgi:hypothetical protein